MSVAKRIDLIDALEFLLSKLEPATDPFTDEILGYGMTSLQEIEVEEYKRIRALLET